MCIPPLSPNLKMIINVAIHKFPDVAEPQRCRCSSGTHGRFLAIALRSCDSAGYVRLSSMQLNGAMPYEENATFCPGPRTSMAVRAVEQISVVGLTHQLITIESKE